MSIQHSEDPPSGGDAPSSPTGSSKKRKVSLGEIEVDLTLPEPPSKKARRALKRGKSDPTNPPAAASADAAAEAAASKKAASKKKPTSAHGVWIGNLPFTATKADIRKWLIDNSGGSITDDAITRVYVPTTRPEADKKKKHDKKKPKKKGAEEEEDDDNNDDEDDDEKSKTKTGNKGFAYVDFTTYATTVAAIALSETSLGGRKLLIKDSKNYEGRPARPEGDDAGKQPDAGKNGASAVGAGATTATNGAAQSRSTKVFVGNLGFKASEDELWAHFEKCGPIRWVKVATFEDTGKCKGFAWVNFQEAEAAAWAVQGFVRIRQTVDTVEDFMDEEEGARGGSGGEAEQKEEDEDEEEQGVDGRGDVDSDGEKTKKKQQARDRKGSKGEGPPQPPRKTKTRKWWVNQLHGRTLKIELAEDDKVRYKKRFGKGGAGAAAAAAKAQGSSRPAAGAAAGTSAPSEQKVVVGDGGSAKEQRAEKEVDPLKVHHDINVARLTGAMVKSQGVKVTFD